jgi:starch synthase (maltosyl-transferring)
MPQRILYTINNLDTAGMKYVLADMVRHLDPARFTPVIGVNRRAGTALEQELQGRCPVHVLGLRVPRRPYLGFPLRAWRLAQRVRGIADLAHAFDYASDWSEGLVMRWAGVPWIAVKTNLVYDPKTWRRKCRYAARIVCLSRYQLSQLSAWSAKLVHVPTGINLASFAEAQPADRAAYGYTADDVILICVAHLVEVKAHKELMRALHGIRDQVPRLKVLLVGRGQEDFVHDLKRLCHELGLDAMIRFQGGSDNVAPLLKMCDGKILMSRLESFGAAIVEAMAAGLPIIATRAGGPQDLVLPGQTGWLAEPVGHEPLIAPILEFYRDPARRQAFGRQGQAIAFAEYGLEKMVERYRRVYEEVLGETGRQATAGGRRQSLARGGTGEEVLQP